MFLRFALLAFLLVFLIPSTTSAENGLAIDPAVCLGCHADTVDARLMARSVHGKNGCTSCHIEIVDLQRHMKGMVKIGRVQCARCHKKEAQEYAGSVHSGSGIHCAGCHQDMHGHTYWNQDKRRVLPMCASCHKDERGFADSVHGKGVMAGNRDSAACHDCHNLHQIMALGDQNSRANREFHTKACLRCHSDQDLVRRNGMSRVAVQSYLESYHGKNYRLGYPDKVAGCADCHSAHGVLPSSDPNATTNSRNLVKTCGVCHEIDGALFTQFYAHGEHRDRERYPVLFYTFAAMTGLLVGVFAVFWLHTLLWMVRGAVEKRQKRAELEEEGVLHTIPNGHRQYRRFSRVHIVMHLMVIVSFLGLSLTGLPLKFSEQKWGKQLVDFFGGAANAGLLHRACAIITFAYFLMALGMSIHFLFIRKDVKGGFWQRLFGPDSLMPNLKDLEDLVGMMKWFFFRGPKPVFERWTYWEKFDFIAVFWGMFAIGGSGLMLWFPELFSRFLPGWAFNVATIIHSDEALLATGFIFTVHFFNTHGRPEKFPMDTVIFNGRISKHQFMDERGAQWARYQKEGLLESVSAGKPSGLFYDFCVKCFGFAALFIGVALLVLMIYAFVRPPG